ncbi:MAG: DoxX family protein [Actinomycetota bacterium]
MGTAYVVVAGFTAVMLATSAGMKLRRHRICVETLETCRVPVRWLPGLATLEGAAAVGIVVGLWWAPLGIAAAAGAVGYFVGAVVAHVRVGDWKGIGAPAFPLVCSVASLVLRIVTA